MSPALLLGINVIFYSLANRFSGGGLGWKSSFRGRPIYYAGLAAIILGWFTAGWEGALAGLTFLLWRIPGWYGGIDAGNQAGTRLRDAFTMFLTAVPFALLYGAIAQGISINPDSIPLVFGASVALGLAIAASYDIAWNVVRPRLKDPVALAELLAGAAWGVFFWIKLS